MQEKRSQRRDSFHRSRIQRWHIRVERQRRLGELKLRRHKREAALLREGNQRWGQMQAERVTQATLLRHPDAATRGANQSSRNTGTRAKYQASQRFETAGWNHSGDYSGGGMIRGYISALGNSGGARAAERNMGR